MYKHIFYVMTENTEKKAIIVIYSMHSDYVKARFDFLKIAYGERDSKDYLNTQWLSTTEIVGFDILA